MIATLWGAFSSSDAAVKAALIGSLTTVVGGFAAFCALIWRLRVEATRAVRELRTAEMMKLKLRIYEEEVIPVVNRIIDAEVALSGYLRCFEMELNSSRMNASRGVVSAAPVARTPELVRLKSAFDLAAVGIVIFVEQWQVVDPRLSIFQTAMNAAAHDVMVAWGAYFDQAMYVFPVDLPGKIFWATPIENVASAVIASGNALIERTSTVSAYAADFRSEMQSVLVGPLFGQSTTKRKPIDPRHRVISLADVEALTQHFEASPWGQSKVATELRVRAEVQRREQTGS